MRLRERNEALDLEVYALAGLYILGQAFVQSLPARATKWAQMVLTGEQAEPVHAPQQPMRFHSGWIPRRRGWIRQLGPRFAELTLSIRGRSLGPIEVYIDARPELTKNRDMRRG